MNERKIDDKVDKVMGCVSDINERRDEFSFGDARVAIDECIDREIGRDRLENEEVKKIRRGAERWLEDSRSEPSATIKDRGRPLLITPYTSPEGWSVEWHSTDAWRGYNEVYPPEGWSKVHEDVSLAYSKDSEMLKKMHEEMKDIFEKKGIDWRAATSRSSNVFSTGYDLFVEEEDRETAEGIINMLKTMYRNPERFKFTAYTGKDPEQANEVDRRFMKGVEMLEEGKSIEEVKEEVTEM